MQIGFFKRNVRPCGAALCAITVALFGVASSAHAGLFNVPQEPADWNGAYMGFDAGVALDHFDVSNYGGNINLGEQLNSIPAIAATAGTAEDETADPLFAFSSFSGGSGTDAGPVGGLHIGYNKQFGHIVGGFEFGFQGTQTSKGPASSVAFTSAFTDHDGSADVGSHVWDSSRYAERNWDGYFGGHLGFAFSRFLFYANGGYTFADIGVHSFDRVKSVFDDDIVRGIPELEVSKSTVLADVTSDIMNGWFVGGGALFALNDKVTLGLDYRHSDFGDQVFRFNVAHPLFPGATRVSVSSDQIEFVVNIMLGHLGAPAAAPVPPPLPATK
jgi:opacity protein-like surface antigen